MSYEDQLLFYKETLKHKKKNMFLLQSCKIFCVVCSTLALSQKDCVKRLCVVCSRELA